MLGQGNVASLRNGKSLGEAVITAKRSRIASSSLSSTMSCSTCLRNC